MMMVREFGSPRYLAEWTGEHGPGQMCGDDPWEAAERCARAIRHRFKDPARAGKVNAQKQRGPKGRAKPASEL